MTLPFSNRTARWRWIGMAALVTGTIAACGDDKSSSAPPGATPDGGPPGTPPSFETSDAAPPDASDGKCTSLNIGILGVPGENASSNFQQWLQNAGTTTQRVQTQQTDVLTSAVLAPFDVVVIDHLKHTHTAEEAQAFKDWLASGRGAMSMSGYLNAPEVDFLANPLIQTVGLNYVSPRFDGPVTQFVPHPITQGITSITFLGGYAIDEVDGSTATRTAVASIANHGNVGYAAELDQGRAFVWGDEWIEFDSEWTTLPQVEQLWVQIFAWLAPNRCKLRPQQPK
jgi:hypothetical protein